METPWSSDLSLIGVQEFLDPVSERSQVCADFWLVGFPTARLSH